MKRLSIFRVLLFAFSLTLGFFLARVSYADVQKIAVSVYSAKTANVNSFVFFDSIGSLIVDATRTSADAREVAKIAVQQGRTPKLIFITHGHPDHYLGLAVLKKEFPAAKIFVASQNVKNDIVNFAHLAEQGHWLDDEPLMLPKSMKNPNGFDYENEIHVLFGNFLTLPGGARIDVLRMDSQTEAAHETLLFSKDLSAIFPSDLVYNGVHLWLRGVDSEAVQNWKNELQALKIKYGDSGIQVYPGHGAITNSDAFDTDLKYLNDFFSIIHESKTQNQAMTEMMAKYPNWENSDFILKNSIQFQFDYLKK
jgi:glyoxylase-like metal-dependent hydrolase (beta-lactamase superfamily II)